MASTAGAGEDDWEYEYHPTETEDFYITLDLSSQIPHQTKPGPKYRRRHYRSKKNAADEEEKIPDPNELKSQPGTAVNTPIPPRQRSLGNKIVHVESQPDNVQLPRTLHFNDLASSTPTVTVDDDVYLCSWSSAIGTDLILRPNNSTTYSLDPGALRSTPNYDLLAATPLRLVATPAKLVPRDENDIADMPTKSSLKAASTPSTGLSFIERLTNIKRARGENDTVPRSWDPSRSVTKAAAASTPVRSSPRTGRVVSNDEFPDDTTTPDTPRAPRGSSRKRRKRGPRTATDSRSPQSSASAFATTSSTVIPPSDQPDLQTNPTLPSHDPQTETTHPPQPSTVESNVEFIDEAGDPPFRADNTPTMTLDWDIKTRSGGRRRQVWNTDETPITLDESKKSAASTPVPPSNPPTANENTQISPEEIRPTSEHTAENQPPTEKYPDSTPLTWTVQRDFGVEEAHKSDRRKGFQPLSETSSAPPKVLDSVLVKDKDDGGGYAGQDSVDHGP